LIVAVAVKETTRLAKTVRLVLFIHNPMTCTTRGATTPDRGFGPRATFVIIL
jgi:hypothetical protein